MSIIEMIKEDLMEEKEEIELLYKLWEIYETTELIHYNIPLPDEINRMHDNEIGYDKFTDPYKIERYKEQLKYYKKVAEYYDNNDLVLDQYIADRDFYDAKQILKYFISPNIRRKAHGICRELEESIKKLESEY